MPALAWPLGSTIALGLAIYAARKLTVWSSAVETTLQTMRTDILATELPDCGDPLFSRIFDACLALASSVANRHVESSLRDRASQATLDALAAANLKWAAGWTRCQLPLFVSEPLAEEAGLDDPASLGSSVRAQVEALQKNGGIVDGFRWGEVAAFFPPGPEAGAKACRAALACYEAALPHQPVAMGLVIASVTLGEIVEGGLTVLGPETGTARCLVRMAKLLGAGALADGAVYKLTAGRFRWRRLGRYKLGWRRLEVYEVLGLAEPASEPGRDIAEVYDQALLALESRNWGGASELFKDCLRLKPADGPSRVCLNFSQRFRNNPPPRSWDGTLVLGPEA